MPRSLSTMLAAALGCACESNDPIIIVSGTSTEEVELALEAGQSIQLEASLRFRWQDEDAFDEVVDGSMSLSVEMTSDPGSEDSGSAVDGGGGGDDQELLVDVALIDDQGNGTLDASSGTSARAGLPVSFCLRHECDPEPGTLCQVNGFESCDARYTAFVTSTSASPQTVVWHFTGDIGAWVADPPIEVQVTLD